MNGTIHEIRKWEQLFIQSMPHSLIHDGHFEPEEFDPTKSASNVSAQSLSYTRKYMLFPHGKQQLWEERVRVTFYFDERHGVGTMKISDRGMHILATKIKGMQVIVKLGKTEVPLKDNIHIKTGGD